MVSTRPTLVVILAAAALVGARAAAAAPASALVPAPVIAPVATTAPARGPALFASAVAETKAAMVSQPQTALAKARLAADLARAEPPGAARDLDVATALWLEGEALIRVKTPQPALPLLDEALKTVETAAPGSKLNGDVLKSRGRASAALGRVRPALSDFQAAYRIYQGAREARSEAMALQEIGSIYFSARDYDHLLAYYAQSSEAYDKDPSLNLVAHNNRGLALRDLGRLPQAQSEFEQALAAARTLGSRYLQAEILSNLGFVQEARGDLQAAEAGVRQGLELAAADRAAAAERPFLLGVLAKVRLRQGRVAEAARLIDQTMAGVDPKTSPMDYRDFHEIAAEAYSRAGEPTLAFAHLQAFKRLDDQGRTLAASTDAALMAARFDFANQDAKIAKLKAGQLERDVRLARQNARMRAVWIGALLLVGGSVLAATILGYLSMRRSRNQVRAVNADLKQALQAKTAFLAATSHEIRTPLNGILGMTQVILARPGLQAEVRERVELVKGAGETMKSLVDDLLDTAKAENGVVALSPAPFDLEALLRETLGFWRDKAEAKSLALRLETEGLPARVVADEGKLRQLLFNLLNNAIKFTDAGEVCVRAVAADGRLTLSVRDTGIGIARADHARVFEAFAQVDNGMSRKYGGTGLGLTICRNIGAAMGGALTVESAAGEGATFTLRAPLVTAPTPAAAAAAGPRASADAAVLVVEANPLTQSIVKAVLAPAVRSVTAVSGLAAALDHLGGAGVDLLIVDAALLGLDDAAAAEGLRSLRRAASDARLLVSRPPAQSGDDARVLACGADALLPKPTPPAALLAAVKAELSPAHRLDTLASAA